MRTPENGSLKRSAVFAFTLLAVLQAASATADESWHPHNVLSSADFGPLDKLLDGARFDPKRGAYFTQIAPGREAELTLDHRLQTQLERELVVGGVTDGAVVLTDPRTGRVLAMAARHDSAVANDFAMKAVAPAASVFKIVTSAALIEAGVDPSRAVCFHGGFHRIEAGNLRDDPRRDNRCASFSDALARSLNLVFGKLADRTLTADALRTMAARFFFNQPLPIFPAPPSVADELVSPAVIPDAAQKLDFGRTAAGFGQVRMSALHGALLASIVANDGMAVTPRLVEALWVNGKRNDLVPTRQQRIIDQATASKIIAMMERTVKIGTARRSFHRGDRRALRHVEVAGKTGTLADKNPYRDNSWFVGFAPADAPEVAVAALAINGPKWRTRAPALARDALEAYFLGEEAGRRASR